MFGLAALVATSVTWLDYLRRIPDERVPERPVAHGIAQGSAIVVAVVGLARREYLSSIVAIVLAAFFLWLLTQARMPDGDLTVRVGDSMPVFEATTASGSTFSSWDRAGTRTLYKFFRGHW